MRQRNPKPPPLPRPRLKAKVEEIHCPGCPVPHPCGVPAEVRELCRIIGEGLNKERWTPG
jgi:hypothetical protein